MFLVFHREIQIYLSEDSTDLEMKLGTLTLFLLLLIQKSFSKLPNLICVDIKFSFIGRDSL